MTGLQIQPSIQDIPQDTFLSLSDKKQQGLGLENLSLVEATGSTSEAPPTSETPPPGSEPTSDQIWADIEITALCICLVLLYFTFYDVIYHGSYKIGVLDDVANLMTKTRNAITNLLNSGNVTPQFTNLANQIMSETNNNADFSYSQAVDIFQENIDFKSDQSWLEYELTYNKDAMQLPENAPFAIFCLTIVAATAVGIECVTGKGTLGLDFLTYSTPDNGSVWEVFGLASCYYLHDSVGATQEQINLVLEATYSTLKNSQKFINYLNEHEITIPELPSFEYPENLPSQEETMANAEALWGSFVEQYTDVLPDTNPNDYINPDQPLPPFNPDAPVNGNGDIIWVSFGSENGVLNQLYLLLIWMQANVDNTNAAVFVLVYLSNLINAGALQDLVNALDNHPIFASNHKDARANHEKLIQENKAFLDECVDITMLQLCMNGDTPQEAQASIDALFPGSDPISMAIKNEANTEAAAIASGEVVVPSDEYELQGQWSTFLDSSQAGKTFSTDENMLLTAQLDYIEIKYPDNELMLAIIWLFSLLIASEMIALEGYQAMSDWLATETNDLNTYQQQWMAGFDTPQDAETWMNNMQGLQEQIDDTGYLSASQKANFDSAFGTIWSQPAVDANGDPILDENGDPVTIGQLAFPDGYTDANGDHVDGGYTDSNGVYHAGGSDECEQELQVSLNTYNPANSPDITSHPQYTAINNSFTNMDEMLTNQSAAVTTEMQQETALINQNVNMLNSMLNGSSGIIGMESASTKNQTTA